MIRDLAGLTNTLHCNTERDALLNRLPDVMNAYWLERIWHKKCNLFFFWSFQQKISLCYKNFNVLSMKIIQMRCNKTKESVLFRVCSHWTSNFETIWVQCFSMQLFTLHSVQTSRELITDLLAQCEWTLRVSYLLHS